MTLEEKIERVEAFVPGTPGTTVSRVLLDRSMWEDGDISPTGIENLKGCAVCWTIGVGGLNQAKVYFYSRTVVGCVDKALAWTWNNGNINE